MSSVVDVEVPNEEVKITGFCTIYRMYTETNIRKMVAWEEIDKLLEFQVRKSISVRIIFILVHAFHRIK